MILIACSRTSTCHSISPVSVCLTVINACNASLRSEKFSGMAIRTRKQYLTDLAENSTTGLNIDQANNSGIVGRFVTRPTHVIMSSFFFSTLLLICVPHSKGRSNGVQPSHIVVEGIYGLIFAFHFYYSMHTCTVCF